MEAAFQFRTGQFKPYRALSQVHLGKYETDIGKDTVIYTDGQTVKIGEYGESLQCPTIKAAIKQGWFADLNDPNAPTEYVPQHAPIQMGPTEGDAKPYERAKLMKTLGGDQIEVTQHEHRIAVSFDGTTPQRIDTSARVVGAADHARSADDLSGLADATTAQIMVMDANGNLQPAASVSTGTPARPQSRVAGSPPAAAPAPVTFAKVEVEDGYEWNKGRHWKKRIAEATGLANDTGKINAILQQETGKVARLIREELGLDDTEFM